jgi:hypothetical protein
MKAEAKKERINLKKNKVVTPAVGRLTTKSASATSASSTANYTTGLGLGYNPSTGYVGSGSTCYLEVTKLNAPVTSSQFSVATGATGFASQTSVSASVSGSYDFFSANASASYSNNYSTTANSGSVFFSASGLYTAVNTFTGLNTFGTQQNDTGSFGPSCGSQFITQASVGGIGMIQFGWGSTSTTASTAIQTAVSASASSGLGSLSAAVTAGNSNSSAADNTYYNASTNQEGGGAIFGSAFAEALSNNQSNQTLCTSGDPSTNPPTPPSPAACDDFATGFNADVVAGISGSSGFMPSYQNSPQDLSGLWLFPTPILGVNGQTNLQATDVSTLETSGGSYPDLFKSYAKALVNYTNIYNQIRTLSNRANYLYGQLQNYPSTTLNVADYIEPLINQYGQDATVMLQNLTSCLTGATSTNISTVCAPIANLYSGAVMSAYDWYGSKGPNPNGYASYALSNLQNNTIALQYTGTYSDSGGSYFKMDVAWINQLPGSGGWMPAPINDNLYSVPAVVGFVDSPWILNYVATTTPYIDIIPLNSGYEITDPFSGWQETEWTIINGNAWSYQNAPVTLSYLNGCQNTSFSSPCSLVMNYTGGFTSSVSLNPINAFFGASTQ